MNCQVQRSLRSVRMETFFLSDALHSSHCQVCYFLLLCFGGFDGIEENKYFHRCAYTKAMLLADIGGWKQDQ